MGHPGRAGLQDLVAAVRGAVNGLAVHVVDAFDGVGGVVNPGVGEKRVGFRQVLEPDVEGAQ